MQNNDKLISANALLEKVQFRVEAKGAVGATVRDMVGITRKLIDEAPAVDAVEVVHGRWEQSVEKDEWYGHIYTCTECEYQCMVDDGTGNEVVPNYCPNCGAKLDGDRRLSDVS